MTTRLDPLAAAPKLMGEWFRSSNALITAFDPILTKLVEIRVSQINGCANCINMHTYFARDLGESNQRIDLVAAWRDAPCYSDRERAALAWAEALTLLPKGHAHEAAYEELKAYFSDEEQVALTMVINVINGWNRIAVGFGGWADPAALRAQTAAAA